MTDKISGFKIYVVTVLIIAAFVCSCKKSVPQGSAEKTERRDTTSAEAKRIVDEGTNKAQVSEAVKPETATPEASVPGLVPLPIKLPRPMFVGTPQNVRVSNLEEPLIAPRPVFYAPTGAENVAFGKTVTGSGEEPIIGELEMITDGDKEAADGSFVELGPFLQYITIDLGAEYEIYAVLLWHYHKQGRVYFDVVAQIADDPDFIMNVRTIFNNDGDNSSGLGIGFDKHYVETAEGKLIGAKGRRSRYVRLYSKGNSSNDLNHYIEVEVFGKLAK